MTKLLYAVPNEIKPFVPTCVETIGHNPVHMYDTYKKLSLQRIAEGKAGV